MLLKEALKLVIKEESDPTKIAQKINEKENEIDKFSNANFNGIINILKNEVRKEGLPIGNGNFINPDNENELNNYINQIYRSINIINDSETDKLIKNILNKMKVEIKSSFNNL